MKKRNFLFRNNMILNGILLLLVSFILIFSVSLVRGKLLQNAQNLGMALADSYAKEEELNLDDLEGNLLIVSRYLDEMVEEGCDIGEIQQWLESYYHKFTGVIGQDMIDLYTVINGRIVAAKSLVRR